MMFEINYKHIDYQNFTLFMINFYCYFLVVLTLNSPY